MTDTEYLEILSKMNIERLGLDNNAISGLYEEKIYTIGDLLKKSNDELVRIASRRHFSIGIIAEKLQGILSELILKGMSGAIASSEEQRAEDAEEDNTSVRIESAVNTEDLADLNNAPQPITPDFGSDPVRNLEEFEEKEKDLLDTPIVDLDISSKAYYALRFSYIETIRDLVSLERNAIRRRYTRLDDENKLQEIAEAIELLFKQAGREGEIEDLPFFSLNETNELHIKHESKEKISDVKQEPLQENESYKTLSNHEEEPVSVEKISLEDCIRIILTNRRREGKEWTTAMTVYDDIRSKYPVIANESQLVDIREVLTNSKWIQKDDFYYRLAPDAEEATEIEIKESEIERKREYTSNTDNRQIEEPTMSLTANVNEVSNEIFTQTLVGNVTNDRVAEIGDVEIEALELSVRAYNCLKRANVLKISDLLSLTEENLLRVRNLGGRSAKEITDKLKAFVKSFDYVAYLEDRPYMSDINDNASENVIVKQKNVIDGHVVYDIPIEQMGLSRRAYNCLIRSGINRISQLSELTIDDLLGIQNMGIKSAHEILDAVEQLIQSGQIGVTDKEDDYSQVLYDHYNSEAYKNKLEAQLLSIITLNGFTGYTKEELYNKARGQVQTDQVDAIIEEVLLELQKKESIYLKNNKYYAHYSSVLDAIEELPEPSRSMISKRLEGMTLEEVSREFDVTRERVRQIVSKQIKTLRKKHIRFSEDTYAYLYENYYISKNDWKEVLALPEYIFNYFQIIYKKGFNSNGFKALLQAVDDTNVDIEIRQAIKAKDDENYIIVGNRRIPKERKYIEDYVISQYFRDEGSLEVFYDTYNRFLEENSVEDINLYATDDVKRTRENRLADSRKVLWKQNRRLRYYDIDGTDFEELLGTLDLGQYENIELSTLKFFRDYPELMTEYDIRDEYELHNLLKKICDPNDYHEMVFGRMPGIVFGEFDRDEAVKEMMFNLAPISQDELADAIFEKYGFKPLTVKANWLSCINVYYINGEYHTEEEDEHPLSDEEFTQLSKLLSDDFYFAEDVDKAYLKVVHGVAHNASPKPYTLKQMGFSVYSGYICRGLNASEFFLQLLTSQDIVDLSIYGSKLRAITMYNQIEYSLREEYEILEFEPYKFVNISRLKAFGIEKSDLRSYCNEVKRFVGEGSYFTLPYLRKNGFTSKLDELGFEDFFYETLLSLDPGITSFILRSGKRNGAALLRVGTEMGSKNDFLISVIEKEGSIEKDELAQYCRDNYGMYYSEHNLLAAIEDSDVYYDSIMEKYYANYSVYYDEI